MHTQNFASPKKQSALTLMNLYIGCGHEGRYCRLPSACPKSHHAKNAPPAQRRRSIRHEWRARNGRSPYFNRDEPLLAVRAIRAGFSRRVSLLSA